MDSMEPVGDRLRNGLACALAGLAARPVFAGRDHHALAEEPGSPWCDALGNALALEALAHPLFAGAHDTLCDDLAAFLLALECRGALRRRAGPPRVAVLAPDTRRFHIETPSHVFTGDLGRGVVRQALRAAPGERLVLHGGHELRFRHRGRRHRMVLNGSLTACGIERFAGGVRLLLEGRATGGGLLGLRPRALATLRCAMEIRADTPVLRLAWRVQAEPGVALEDVRVMARADAAQRDGFVRLRCGDGIAALHLRAPSGPPPVLHLAATAAARANRVVTGHGGVAVPAGGAVEFTEDRLLLTGHPRSDAAALFARATAERGRDAALCPHPGLAAQSLAAFLALRTRTGPAPDPALWDALDRMLATVRAAESSAVSDLAFLTLAEDCLARSLRGAHAPRHAAALERLLTAAPRTALDHAAVILALARAATLTSGDARLAPGIARSLAALEGVDLPDLERALLLRALHAVHAARARPASVHGRAGSEGPLPPAQQREGEVSVSGALHLGAEDVARLARLTREHGAWAQARADSAEGPAALRAALLLGLLAPDALMMRLRPPASRHAA
ncbi:MAG TPA: hypothetical protein VD970_06515 [Acetobacteraceae bacterium]|nr:hypothetical protein [Acetobacteraceae bacterium]